jgi:hypothetical protein
MNKDELHAMAIAANSTRLAELTGDDEQDTFLLRQMSVEARHYLESFSWCAAILDGWFAQGVGGIFGLFLFRILPASPEIEEWLWIMNGDLPSIYLGFDQAPSVQEAFREYIEGIRRWIIHVRCGAQETPDDVPPITTPKTTRWADDLERRIDSLEQVLSPLFFEP